MRLREAERLGQGHTASKWSSSNTVLRTPRLEFYVPLWKLAASWEFRDLRLSQHHRVHEKQRWDLHPGLSNYMKFPLHSAVSLDSSQKCSYIILYSKAGGMINLERFISDFWIKVQLLSTWAIYKNGFQPLLVCSSLMSLCLLTLFRTCPMGFGPVWKALTFRLQVSFSFGWFFIDLTTRENQTLKP